MARKSKDKAYVANYPPLRDWLAEHGMRCNWQLPCGSDPEDPSMFVESYSAMGKRDCIVTIRADGNGWGIYTSYDSNKIDETLSNAQARLGLNNRKLTLGERIDRDGGAAPIATKAQALLDQYRAEGGNGIDRDDAAGLCESILALLK